MLSVFADKVVASESEKSGWAEYECGKLQFHQPQNSFICHDSRRVRSGDVSNVCMYICSECVLWLGLYQSFWGRIRTTTTTTSRTSSAQQTEHHRLVIIEIDDDDDDEFVDVQINKQQTQISVDRGEQRHTHIWNAVSMSSSGCHAHRSYRQRYQMWNTISAYRTNVCVWLLGASAAAHKANNATLSSSYNVHTHVTIYAFICVSFYVPFSFRNHRRRCRRRSSLFIDVAGF